MDPWGGLPRPTARERGQCSSTVLEHFADARSKVLHTVCETSAAARQVLLPVEFQLAS